MKLQQRVRDKYRACQERGATEGDRYAERRPDARDAHRAQDGDCERRASAQTATPITAPTATPAVHRKSNQNELTPNPLNADVA